MRNGILWAGIALVCACAGPVYEGKYSFDEGWNIGVVTEVGTADAIHERSTKDCRLGAIAEGHSGRTFARVLFQRARQHRSIVALVPAGVRLERGEAVYVDYRDCGMEIAVAR